MSASSTAVKVAAVRFSVVDAPEHLAADEDRRSKEAAHGRVVGRKPTDAGFRDRSLIRHLWILDQQAQDALALGQ